MCLVIPKATTKKKSQSIAKNPTDKQKQIAKNIQITQRKQKSTF